MNALAYIHVAKQFRSAMHTYTYILWISQPSSLYVTTFCISKTVHKE